MRQKRNTGGIILIVVGVIFFLKNFINIPFNIDWSYIWPVIVIIIGWHVMTKNR